MRVNGHSHRAVSMIEKERRRGKEEQIAILEREGRANLSTSISRNITVQLVNV